MSTGSAFDQQEEKQAIGNVLSGPAEAEACVPTPSGNVFWIFFSSFPALLASMCQAVNPLPF